MSHRRTALAVLAGAPLIAAVLVLAPADSPSASAAPATASRPVDPGVGFAIGGTTTLVGENGALFGSNEQETLLWTGGRVIGLGKGTVIAAVNREGWFVGKTVVNGTQTPRLWRADGTVAATLPGEAFDIADDRTVVVRRGAGAGLWRDGVVTDLRVPPLGDGTTFTPVDLNNRGQVAGIARLAVGTQFPVRCQADGSCTVLAKPPLGSGTVLRVEAINDSGRVVGEIGDVLGSESGGVAVRWDGDEATPLTPLPGTTRTEVARGRGALNNRGEVIGYSYEFGTYRDAPVLWGADGTPGRIDPGLGRSAILVEVNENGTVVANGHPSGDTSAVTPFVWQSGAVTQLAPLTGLPVSRVHGLTDSGRVAGFSEVTIRFGVFSFTQRRPTYWDVR